MTGAHNQLHHNDEVSTVIAPVVLFSTLACIAILLSAHQTQRPRREDER